MSFQFTCPQGHLLEGAPSQSGQQITCPVCQQLFIIPSAPQSAPPAVGPPSNPPAQQPFSPTSHVATSGLPQVGPNIQKVNPFEEAEPVILHIPCPNCKKELETPPDLLDIDVMCPHCDTQFHLREKDSIEHKRKQQEQMEQHEFAVGRKWLSWAIAIAILAFLFLAILIGISTMD